MEEGQGARPPEAPGDEPAPAGDHGQPGQPPQQLQQLPLPAILGATGLPQQPGSARAREVAAFHGLSTAGGGGGSQSTQQRSSSGEGVEEHHQQRTSGGKPKRNPRQQEQNKQAQQRYRAKRKAQFEEMQSTVQVLTQQVQALQREKQQAQALQVELLRLQALVAERDTALAGSAAELQRMRVAAAAAPAAAGAAGAAPAELNSSGGGKLASPGSTPAAGGGGGAAAVVPTPALIQHALQMYYQDLQQHAAASHVEHLHPSGRDAGVDTLRELSRLLQAGAELIKMVLQATGPGAQQLLVGVAVGSSRAPPLPSPADNHQLWQQVALRLQLSVEQRQEIQLWRDRYVQSLDEIYGRRLLLKAQMVQMAGGDGGAGGSGAPQWAESVLLKSVTTSGYSASAHAAVELEGLLEELRENIRQERDMAGEMMQALLTQVLTPVQSARYLLAGHPFTWNGLAFAHSLASTAAPGGA